MTPTLNKALPTFKRNEPIRRGIGSYRGSQAYQIDKIEYAYPTMLASKKKASQLDALPPGYAEPSRFNYAKHSPLFLLACILGVLLAFGPAFYVFMHGGR